MIDGLDLLFKFVREQCDKVPGFDELDDFSKDRIVTFGAIYLASAFVDKFFNLVDKIKENGL